MDAKFPTTNEALAQARNVLLYLLVGAGILYALPLANSYFPAHGSIEGAGTVLPLFVKFAIKLLPLSAAIILEILIAAEVSLAINRFLAWKKSERIDIYCFLLGQFHKLVDVLRIVFSLGIPFFLNPWIAAHLPHKIQLFPFIEKSCGLFSAAAVFIVTASFFNYWEHRIWHSKLMWPIHRFHHSATDYNLLTETRKHFSEILSTPIFFTVPMTMLGAPVEFLIGYIAFMQFHGFISHSDSGINYGWIGRYLLADPRYHKIHHSTASEHMNKNFASLLPIWDKIFGSHAFDRRPISVGVIDADHYEKLPYWQIFFKDASDFLRNLKAMANGRRFAEPTPQTIKRKVEYLPARERTGSVAQSDINAADIPH